MSLFDYKIKFTKDWTNPSDFPAYEAEESKVRADMQYLFDEIKQGFNNFVDNLKASLLPFDKTENIDATTVQDAIEAVQRQAAAQALGQIPDGTLENVKLVDKTVENTKIKDGTVITSLIADGAVTTSKIADAAVETAKIADGAVTAEKLDAHAVEGKADLVDGRVASKQAAKRVDANALASRAAYTLAVSDANSVLYCVNILDATVTIPLNSTAALPVGTVIEIIQNAAGKVTITPATGVTLTSFASVIATTGVGSKLVLVKVNTNVWHASCMGAVGTAQIVDSSIVESKVADGTITATATGTIAYDLWSGEEEPYTQTVTVEMLKTYATYTPRLGLNASETYATAILEKEGWGYIVDADVDSEAGTITFRASSKPEVDLNFTCEVNKR